MKENVLNQYIRNNESISKLMAENEKILREEGYNPPVDNFCVKKENRVNVPAGYIRKKEDFCKEYHLVDIVNKINTRNNISYALQLSDYYNFFFK